MSYLLIALIVFIALAPLLSVMPSRRQRHIAELRQAAAVAGLFVKLRELSGAGPQAYYGRARERGQPAFGGPVSYRLEGEKWLPERGGWGEERLALLGSFPAGVSAVCEDAQGVGVYWNERGSREEVLEIDRLLRRLLQTSG